MDDAGNIKFEIEKTHTDEMIAHEVQSMLGASKILLTLGMVESLWLLKSPYILGGKIEADDLGKALEIIPHGDLQPLDFHTALLDELAAAWRAYEIIVPDDKPTGDNKHSEIDTFSPEWLADTINQATQAMPSLTYKQILWEVPLTMILHLGISTARRNGAITRRPDDMQEALKMLREHNRQDKENK